MDSARRFAADLAATTDRWWYLPAAVAATAVVVEALVVSGAASPRLLEALVAFVLVPGGFLAAGAMALDLVAKSEGHTPPGLVGYPAATLLTLALGTFWLYLVVAVYLLVWVRPGWALPES